MEGFLVPDTLVIALLPHLHPTGEVTLLFPFTEEETKVHGS